MNRFINKYSNLFMWIAGGATLLAILLSKTGVFETGAVVLYLIATVLCGFPIFYRGVQGLRFKTVGIEVLVSIAVIGALVIAEFSEAAIVTFLFQFGSYLEQKTMRKTRNAIKELTQMAPATAFRVEGDEVEEIDADEVEEEDILLVKTGNQVPVDGNLVFGEGYVNEASITGESVPVKKSVGDFVYAGTILDSGSFRMQATRVGEDTTFAKIIELVEEAQDAKSPVERFINRFSKYYTPAVVVMAVLVFIFFRDLDTAITVLVLACPGALVIGAPIANVAGIGRGAKNGVLLKGGDSVYTFAKTDTVVFDKTGTLTKGAPEVIEAKMYGDVSLEEALSEAAGVEQTSEHPLAKAIVSYAKSKQVTLLAVEKQELLKGMGVAARLGESEILVGSERLMEDREIHLNEQQKTDITRLQNQGASTVLYAKDGQIQLLFAVADAIREDAKESVQKLQKMGMRHIAMLTGDNESTAKAVAAQIGISEVYAELLPEDKLQRIKNWQKDDRCITFVGDGVNDSPALTLADTGIAMGGGTDVAIDSSDVVLIQSRLTAIVEALSLARFTKRIMFENIAIAVGTVVLLLIGLFAGYVHMALGMLIHEASILLVIFNAMRLLIGSKKKG
ncbi:MAG: heavy metal translocating P-type ATPase [Lachnospiraceae bacterium]|nr:heavy metal translocating P-type ATPase [Lachnospiraceae bacterium]MDD6191932.1 heavy metal translocating P-type ATPase [Lachnospiraceae bacterium]MDY4793108.1 heavy metal translocating P-type ATPase [Pararoseburia sp.]